MDNFEYSIQLNDREWAEFLSASEECDLAPATLATAEEQCLSDIEQGDGVPGRDCTEGQVAAKVGSDPGPGWGHSAPRGVAADTSLSRPAGGHLSPTELLSGSEDEAELGSVSRFLSESHKPARPRSPPMPSAQRRQTSCPPSPATPAGGTAPGTPRQNAGCEEPAAPQPPSEEGEGSGCQAMEPPKPPAGAGAQGGEEGGEEPRASPLAPQPLPLSGSPATGRKNPRTEPVQRGPPRDHPPSPSLETAPKTREEASGEKPNMEPSSPDVVRPKVPGQQRKNRKQRGAGATEAAQGDREPAGAAAQGAAVKAPLSSPLTSRKSKGKEKAAKPPLVKVGSEEAAESKRPVPSPGRDEGEAATSAPPKQKVKEPPGTQPPGKAKATKHSKPEQAGGLGICDTVAVIPANGAVVPAGEACQEVLEKPLHPKSMVASERAGSGTAPKEPAAEPPVELGPPCSVDGASAKVDTLDVTWPEMYEYLFCESQGEEEELGNSLEGEKKPLEGEMSWPELYEYFFSEPEGNRKKVKGKERKRKKFSSLDHTELQNDNPSSAPVKDSLVISVPEMSKHFFSDGPRNRTGWRGIFPITSASEVKKAVGALKSLLQRPVSLVRGQSPAPQALVRRGSGEKLALIPLSPLGRGQESPEGLDMALALTGSPEAPLVLTHKDMCLVFCAFASWAVKTSDLQAPDAWKTMFLASFGTLSAIRYFRRQVREGHPRI
ncbi:PGC-1 and ERR-induced regulator in muscle protein 1 [Heliangelus exortis]|uniref:PGC-1 and ERR-induced regulator in muscle protein 1 n=1 Tax=Heliangelus exortis TaxID=472823 RepID=UPI003A8CA9A6